MYNGLNIIADAFENRIFEIKYRPEIDVDIDSTSDSDAYETHGLTDKWLQIFRKRFSKKNPEKLRQALIETTDEKYNGLLKLLNIKLSVLKDQIKTEVGVERTRLEHLVNTVEGILDNVRWRGNIPKF